MADLKPTDSFAARFHAEQDRRMNAELDMLRDRPGAATAETPEAAPAQPEASEAPGALETGWEAAKKSTGVPMMVEAFNDIIKLGPNRKSAGDLFEGLLHGAFTALSKGAFPAAMGLGAALQQKLEEYPALKELEILNRYEASAIRRLFDVPHRYAELIRKGVSTPEGGFVPTLEEADLLDAPMTAGEFAGLVVSLGFLRAAHRGGKGKDQKGGGGEPARPAGGPAPGAEPRALPAAPEQRALPPAKSAERQPGMTRQEGPQVPASGEPRPMGGEAATDLAVTDGPGGAPMVWRSRNGQPVLEMEKPPGSTAYQLAGVPEELAMSLETQGGFSYSVAHGPVQFPKGSRAVSIAPERETAIQGKATPEDIAAFIEKNRDILDDPRAILGAEYLPEANRTNLDISIAADAASAQEVGRMARQRAVYDPEAGVSEPVGYGAGPHPYHKAAEALRPGDVEAARAYDAAKSDPALRPQWEELATETEQMFTKLSERTKVEFVDGQPYASAEQMAKGVKETGVLKVSKENNEHPFWSPEQNMKFRAVHDMIHVERGHDFTLRGEERAWLAHSEMLTGEGAKTAVKTEVYGQAASAVANAEFAPQKAVDLGGTGLPPIEERLGLGLDLAPKKAAAKQAAGDAHKFRPSAQETTVSGDARAAYAQLVQNDKLLDSFKANLKTRVQELLTGISKDAADVTGAAGAGIMRTREFRAIFKDAITVGAVEIHKGANSFKAFSERMLEQTGEFIKPELRRLYDESKKLHKAVVMAAKGGLPSVQKLEQLQRAGEDGGVWYHGVMPELEVHFKQDAPLVRKFIAATSPLQQVDRNIDLALEAYAAYKSTEGFDHISFGVATPNVRANLKRVAEWWDAGADPNVQPLRGLKVEPFDRAMAGDTSAFVADRWIWRLFYGKDIGTLKQHEFMRTFAQQEASRLGVSVRDFQAQLWVAYKSATEQANRGAAEGPGRATRGTLEPLRDVIRKKLEQPLPEDPLFERIAGMDALGIEGKVDLGTALTLARAGIGAAVGAYSGDTPEEQFQNALLGAFGFAIAPSLIRPMVRMPGRTKAMTPAETVPPMPPEVHKARLEQTPYQPNYNYIQASAEVKNAMRMAYNLAHERIKAGRKGVQTHDKTRDMADKLITSGELTVEKVLGMAPSDAPQPAHIAKAMRSLEVGIADYAVRVKDRVLAGQAVPGELRQVIALQTAFAERVALMRTGTGRALDSFRIEAEAAGGLRPETVARFGDGLDPRLSEMDLARMIDVAEKVDSSAAAKKGFLGMAGSFPEVFTELFYGSILWGKAIGRNFFGNLTLELGSSLTHMVAGHIPSWLPGVGKARPLITPGETAARIHGHIEGFRKNLIAKSRLEALEDVGGGKFEMLRGKDWKPAIQFTEPANAFQVATNYLGYGLRGSAEILNKNDIWNKSHLVNAELHGMAYRRATTEGLTGEKFKTRYEELVNDPAKFSKSEREYMARRVKQDTYTSEIEFGPAKAIVDTIGQYPGFNAAVRVGVFAFPRITSNMYETFASYTPGLNLLSTRFWKAMREGGAEGQLAYSRLATGTAIYSTLLYFADEGVITGDRPTNKAQAMGLPAFPDRSVNVGGNWISYRGLGFLEDMLAFSANARTMIANLPEKELINYTYAMGLSIFDVVDNMAFVQTFGEFASILERAHRPEQRVQNLAEYFQKKGLSLVPGSGMWREIRRMIDPVRREVETFGDRLRDGLPFLSESGFPRRDRLTGEPISVYNVPGITTSTPKTQSPVWQEVYRLAHEVNAPILRDVPAGLVPGMDPSESVQLSRAALNREGLALTPKQQDRYAELMTQEIEIDGKSLHENLAELVASPLYLDQSDETKAVLISDRYNAYYNAAKALLLDEDEGLRRKYQQVMGENNIKLLPPEAQPAARDALRGQIGVYP